MNTMEIFFVIVVLGLIGLIGYEKHEDRKERAKLLNAILSKDTEEFKNLELVDKTQIKVDKPKSQEFEIPENQSDEDWYKAEIEPKLK